MMRTIILMLLLVLSNAVASDRQTMRASAGIRCHESKGIVTVNFGMTRRPTFFGIQTPKDKFIYLRYPPQGIDVLGQRYKKDPIELDIDTLSGVAFDDDKPVKTRVFDVPGEYTLRFQDANRAEHEDLFALSCGVRIGHTAAVGEQVSQTTAIQAPQPRPWQLHQRLTCLENSSLSAAMQTPAAAHGPAAFGLTPLDRVLATHAA